MTSPLEGAGPHWLAARRPRHKCLGWGKVAHCCQWLKANGKPSGPGGVRHGFVARRPRHKCLGWGKGKCLGRGEDTPRFRPHMNAWAREITKAWAGKRQMSWPGKFWGADTPAGRSTGRFSAAPYRPGQDGVRSGRRHIATHEPRHPVLRRARRRSANTPQEEGCAFRP